MIVVGDSAGGLLLTGVIILCIELAISPARLLSLADPLIPYPALAACMGAYLGKSFNPDLALLPGVFVEGGWEAEEEGNVENCSRQFETLELEEFEGVTAPRDDYHLSPLMTPDYILRKFPSTVFAVCQKIEKNNYILIVVTLYLTIIILLVFISDFKL